ncbi:MAG: hypothetical protein ACRC92_18145 [Peptostreptococcaceae bacterium]
MDKFKIEMPSEYEIQQQINLIVDKSIPPKESFYSYISKMYKDIGISNVFHDLSELTYIGVLTIAVLVFSFISLKNNEMIMEDKIYTFIFTISPLFYLATNLFSYINMKENNTYEMEMVCKYNLYQVASLRMLVFSVICILLNTIFIVGLYNKINVLRGIMISTSAVFIFSSLLLFAIVKVKSKLAKYLVISSWVIANGAIMSLSMNEYAKILQNVPIVVYLVVTVIAAYMYLSNIKVLLKYKTLFN